MIKRCVVFSILILSLFFSSIGLASFKKELWPFWTVTNFSSAKTISHQDWQLFLDKHLITNKENINVIDYAQLTQDDRQSLKQYIEKLSHIEISQYNRQEQLAFWINLYNALTVYTVASYYPVTSIEEINISPGLFSVGPWTAKMVTVNNTALSLEDIHSRIIRPIWNDNRTHYAINNGSIGAPNLNKHAYSALHLNEQLDEAASGYINSLRGVQVISDQLVVSRLYEWFIEDFGNEPEYVIKHLQQYAQEPLKTKLNDIHSINSYFL